MAKWLLYNSLGIFYGLIYIRPRPKLVGKTLITLNPLNYIYTVNRATGEARCTQLAISFNVVKKHGEISNQRPGKRSRRDIEDLTP